VCVCVCCGRIICVCWPVLRITVVVLLTCRGLSHVRVQLYIMIGACGSRGGIRHHRHHPLAASCAVHSYMYILYYRLHTRRDVSRRVSYSSNFEFLPHCSLYQNYNNIIKLLLLLLLLSRHECRQHNGSHSTA